MKEKMIGVLPLGAYTSQEWFDKEMKNIFSNSWQFAGLVEDVANAGDYITVQAGLNNIFIMRSHTMEIKAYHNVCRHRGTQLLQAKGTKLKVITCPYHDWVYDVQGNLISVPEKEAEFPDLKHPLKECGLNLHEAKVGVFKGMLFVHPDKNAKPLSQYFEEVEPFLGPHKVEELVEYSERDGAPFYSKIIEANWKIIVENYIDHYHLSHLHKNTLNMYNHKKAKFGWAGKHYWFYEPLVPKYAADVNKISPFPLIDSIPENQIGAYVPWFFPNIGISESESSWSTFHVEPISPTKTKVTIRTKVMNVDEAQWNNQYQKASVHPFWEKYEETETDSSPLQSGDFMKEDVYVCEQMQKSLQSPYFSVGKMAVKGEKAILQFQEHVLSFLSE